MDAKKLKTAMVKAFSAALTDELAQNMIDVIDAKLEDNERDGADGKKAKENFAAKISLEKTSDGKYSGRLKLLVKKVVETSEEAPVNLDVEQQELNFDNE